MYSCRGLLWGGSEGGGAAGTGGREPNRIWKLFSDSRTDTTHKKTKTREETNIGSRGVGLILSEGERRGTLSRALKSPPFHCSTLYPHTTVVPYLPRRTRTTGPHIHATCLFPYT